MLWPPTLASGAGAGVQKQWKPRDAERRLPTRRPLWQPVLVARVIRAQLDGPDAEPGRIPASDVARLILGLERAIARAAYLVLGQRWRGTGRHRQAIENAARLRFIGVESGSFVELLALPETNAPTEDELPVSVADLGSLAFDRLLDALGRDQTDVDAELAAVIARMAAELGIGDRNTALILTDHAEEPNSERSRRGYIDVSVRHRMQDLGSQIPRSREETLVGVLVEADFEGQTARLRLADGNAVTVDFPNELADEIQQALRSQAGFEGAVRYHPTTAQAVAVELRAVVRGSQLALGGEAFWQPNTFSRLQAAQGTRGLVYPAELAIADLSDDERSAFLAGLSSDA